MSAEPMLIFMDDRCTCVIPEIIRAKLVTTWKVHVIMNCIDVYCSNFYGYNHANIHACVILLIWYRHLLDMSQELEGTCTVHACYIINKPQDYRLWNSSVLKLHAVSVSLLFVWSFIIKSYMRANDACIGRHYLFEMRNLWEIIDQHRDKDPYTLCFCCAVVLATLMLK